MTEATTAPPAEPKRGFKLPSAYTILFALIVLMALATWLIPAGAYQLDKEGAPIPGTYTEVDGDPAAHPDRLPDRPHQRALRDRGRRRERSATTTPASCSEPSTSRSSSS